MTMTDKPEPSIDSYVRGQAALPTADQYRHALEYRSHAVTMTEPAISGSLIEEITNRYEAADLLAVELGDNDSDKATLGGFLVGMIDLDGKRPYGNSGWQYDLFAALIRAGKLEGALDGDGYVETCDYDRGYELIAEAAGQIKAMFR
jgi:hypothetical protein